MMFKQVEYSLKREFIGKGKLIFLEIKKNNPLAAFNHANRDDAACTAAICAHKKNGTGSHGVLFHF